ncbi:MAG: 23S rRNA (adenine(2503)-C(2))-methyltransferase RlmN [Spirochaetales bacterium]|nr:23S rRNA (adenine(2503)-C(2))-methyltransferase RlmN [Spirochaetales bacterium]
MEGAELAEAAGFDKGFRALQVFRWIARGASAFADMSDLPLAERDRLERDFGPLYGTRVDASLEDDDGTVKLRVRLEDGAAVECVLLTDIEGRMTACISTQVGCPMACAFCKTGTLGFLRNLDPHEIVEQYLHLAKRYGRPSNLVFMGMGEPLLNLEAVRKSIAVLSSPDGFDLSYRKITISTCGIVPGIRDLAANGPHVRLAISLTAADDALRSELMPVNRRWPLAELRAALLEYQKATGDRITLEAALMGDRNCGPGEAEKLARFIGRMKAQVNLIPWNPVEGLPFREPSRSQVEAMERRLEELGVVVNRRMKRGRGVSGACGQLGDTGEVAPKRCAADTDRSEDSAP